MGEDVILLKRKVVNMYKIEKTTYGVKLTFEGLIDKSEMSKWVAESEKFVSTLPAKFGVFVDMRKLKTLDPEAKNEMQKGQKLYMEKVWNAL